MSDKLCGLAGLGLDNLEDMDIFGQEKKEEQAVVEAPKIEEKDLIYDKNFTCPVCGEDFSTKIMKTGKARLLGTDQDLRAKYEGIDAVKYDVILCPHCGYAALNRYFNNITKVYAKLIKENISSKVQLHTYDDDIYTYEEAIERYKLCLANAVVKRAHASEKAYICLKSGWLMRGYQEYLEESGDTDMARLREVKNMEEAYLKNAYTGFTEALQTEGFPMCGMDEITVELDMRARLVELNEAQAIVRGPLVLARDSRFKDGDVDEASVIVSKDGYVELTPVQAPDFAWMAFTVPMVLGTDLEGNGKARPIHLCDFASAGNTWNQAERYRVWLPKTWNVMRTPYKPFTPAQCVRSLNSEGVTPSFFLKNVENWPAFSKCRL